MKMLRLIIICSLALTASMTAFSSCDIEVPSSWAAAGLTPGVDIKVDACKYKGGSTFESELSLTDANAFTTKVNDELKTCKCNIENKSIEADDPKAAHCASSRSFKAETVNGKTVIKVNATTVVPDP
jgi:hypothetical protein